MKFKDSQTDQPRNGTMSKPIILAFVPFYLPGFKAGGPVRSIANMVKVLGDEFDFRIFTSATDFREKQPYPNVRVDEWNTVGNAQVYYASPKSLSLIGCLRLFNETNYDILYLNSFFNLHFTIGPLVLRRLWLIPDRPVVLAPRGELAQAALAIKWWKKKPYRFVAHLLGLYKNILWHASSLGEAADIYHAKGATAMQLRVAVAIAADMASSNSLAKQLTFQCRPAGAPLRVCFLARVVPIKNLDYALRVLTRVTQPVQLNIYGILEDKSYWNTCQNLMQRLPKNVTVTYRGQIAPTDVDKALQAQDLFMLPTKGENYGHSIVEALSNDLPVLISDRTPWRNLEKYGAGWDLPLEEPERFRSVIEKCAAMSDAEQLAQRANVQAFFTKTFDQTETIDQNRALFSGGIIAVQNGARAAG